MEKNEKPEFSGFFYIFRLTGGAHWPLSNTSELLSAFFTPVIFPLDPIRGDLDIYGTANSAHVTLTSIGCMGRR